MKWKYFPRYLPFVRVIHRSQVNYPHKGQWHGALMFSFICTWINDWVNNREAGDLRRHGIHYDVTVMVQRFSNFPVDSLVISWLRIENTIMTSLSWFKGSQIFRWILWSFRDCVLKTFNTWGTFKTWRDVLFKCGVIQTIYFEYSTVLDQITKVVVFISPPPPPPPPPPPHTHTHTHTHWTEKSDSMPFQVIPWTQMFTQSS